MFARLMSTAFLLCCLLLFSSHSFAQKMIDEKAYRDFYQGLNSGNNLNDLLPGLLLQDLADHIQQFIPTELPAISECADENKVRQNFCLAIFSLAQTGTLFYSYDTSLSSIREQFKEKFDSQILAYYQWGVEQGKWPSPFVANGKLPSFSLAKYARKAGVVNLRHFVIRSPTVFYEYLKEGRLLTREEERGRIPRLSFHAGEDWIYLEANRDEHYLFNPHSPETPVMYFDLSLLDASATYDFYAHLGWNYGKMMRSTVYSRHEEGMKHFFSLLAKAKAGEHLDNELMFSKSIPLIYLQKMYVPQSMLKEVLKIVTDKNHLDPRIPQMNWQQVIQ